MIRLAEKGDLAGVQICARDAYRKYVEAIGREPAPMVADFETQIEKGQVYVWLNDAADVEGFIAFAPRNDHMFLENVAVLSEAAGKGIGKALIMYCEAEAKRLGVRSVELYTNEKMTENLSIYPHLGYEETGRRTEDGFDRVYFRKWLD